MPTLKQYYTQFDTPEFNTTQRDLLSDSESLPSTKNLRAYRLANVKRPAPIENLVLKGAGVLGPAYAGAILELEQQKMFSGVKRVAGSSAGGLLAIFIAVGFPPKRIKEIMLELQFNKLLTNPDSSLARKIWNYLSANISNYFSTNLDDGEKFQKKLEGYIHEAISKHHIKAAQALGIKVKDFKSITFRQLQAIRKKEEENDGTSTIKELYLTGTNTTFNEQVGLPKGLIYFSHEHNHAENMAIALAGLTTASHPFAWLPVRHKIGHQDHWFTDGAVADACPVTFFDKPKYVSPEHPLDCNGKNPHTLAIVVDSEYLIKKHHTHHTKDVFLNRIQEWLYEIFRRHAFRDLFDPKVDNFREDNHPRILQIHDCDVDMLDFTLTNKMKRELIEHGELAMRRHIRNYLTVDSYLPNENFGTSSPKPKITFFKKVRNLLASFLTFLKKTWNRFVSTFVSAKVKQKNREKTPYKNQYTSYKNFQNKYAHYNDNMQIKYVIEYEIQPAIERYQDALKNQPQERTKIMNGLALYKEELKAAQSALDSLTQKRKDSLTPIYSKNSKIPTSRSSHIKTIRATSSSPRKTF